MRRVSLLFLMILSLSVSGCRNNPRVASQIDQMGQQRRALEDQIYDLQYEYDKKEEQLERLQEENARLREQLGELDHRPAGNAADQPDQPDQAGPALIDLSAGGTPIRVIPNYPEEPPPVSPASFGQETPSSLSSLSSSAEVQHIEFNKLRTVLRDANNNRRVDTVVLHLTPRDADGHFLAKAEDVEIVIREGRSDGRLVGQWKVSARQLQAIIDKSFYRSTIPVELELGQELDFGIELYLEVQFGARGVRTSGVLSSKGISTSRSHWSPYR